MKVYIGLRYVPKGFIIIWKYFDLGWFMWFFSLEYATQLIITCTMVEVSGVRMLEMLILL